MFRKMRNIVRAKGVSGLAARSVAYAYRRGVRPYVPGEPVRYAGIPICHDRKWGDRLVPTSWIPYEEASDAQDEPGYEAALVAGLNETVRPGDRVVIVGAGLGVTAVVAALRAGVSGTVQCFEGSKEHVGFSKQTVARNNLTNVTVHHAVVAKNICVYGSGSDVAPVMPPSQLPLCNVLQLDCEGAEVGILREMEIQPRIIIAETHGLFGAPTDLIVALLEKRGYDVSDRGVAEPRLGDFCTKHDIRVALGIIHPAHGFNSLETS
jgi:hypothetical protein